MSYMQRWMHVCPSILEVHNFAGSILDEIIQMYSGYFDELHKRDHKDFDASDATISALSQVTCDVIKWTCTASVIRAEVVERDTPLRLSDVPSALGVSEATPATRDGEEHKNTRTVRFLTPRSDDVEQALRSSVSDESKTNHKVEVQVKGNAKADSPGGESDDDVRPAIKNMVPQGIDAFEDASAPGSDDIIATGAGAQGLWQSQFPRRKWAHWTKARKPQQLSSRCPSCGRICFAATGVSRMGTTAELRFQCS